MSKVLSVVCLVVALAVAVPAQAQLRQDVQAQRAGAKLFSDGAAGALFNHIFNPEHFRMHHSYEMSFGSMGGSASSLGMYTNTMMWQFNQKLAARVDVAFAHSPFGGNNFGSGMEGNGGQVFLRNAEIAYRPAENMQLHFSIRQSPYGMYGSPYGMYRPYYSGFDRYGMRDGLFWNERLR
jgi:hypothetical protein